MRNLGIRSRRSAVKPPTDARSQTFLDSPADIKPARIGVGAVFCMSGLGVAGIATIAAFFGAGLALLPVHRRDISVASDSGARSVYRVTGGSGNAAIPRDSDLPAGAKAPPSPPIAARGSVTPSASAAGRAAAATAVPSPPLPVPSDPGGAAAPPGPATLSPTSGISPDQHPTAIKPTALPVAPQSSTAPDKACRRWQTKVG